MSSRAKKLAARAGCALAAAMLLAIGALAAAQTAAVPDRPTHVRLSKPPPLNLKPLALPARIKIPSYRPGAIPFRQGETLVFLARWIGIPVATARFRLRPDPGIDSAFTEEATIRTNGLADLFYPMRDYMRERMSRTGFAPDRAYIRQDEKHRVKEYLVYFDRRRGVATAVERYRGRTEVRRFKGTPFGPLSAITMALSQPLKVGQKLTFDVISGRYRFVFSFLVDRRERITTPMGKREALRLVPSVDYVSEGDLKGSARSAVIWVSAKRHLPLRIESEAFIGRVRADLIRIEHASAAPSTPSATPRGGKPSVAGASGPAQARQPAGR